MALDKEIDFLNSIGIPTSLAPGSSGFLAGVKIADGCLRVDPECDVSDLLHEAGHVAIFPSRYRRSISGDVGKAQREMLDDLVRLGVEPDDPLYRAAIQTSDPEATAWAWAAGIHLGLRPEEIILTRQYDGSGSYVRVGLALGLYVGVHGLAHAGFCASNRLTAEYRRIPLFPKLTMWVQQ